MNKKVRLAWVDIGMGIGNAYGYSTHARNMKKHVAEIADLTPDADAAVQIQTPDKFQPIAGKKNFLFTMYEAETIPHIFIKGINHPECHHIIVPCNHNKRVFRPWCDKPISVCHEGANIEKYYFAERQFPKGKKPFRFLWVGAPNPRKGWEEVVAAWYLIQGTKQPGIELYLKTTMGDLFEKQGNVTYDSRNLSLKELIDLYHSAHCFVFPTRGEGWGLCGKANTILHTKDMVSTFKTVQPGDFILSGDGKYHLVLDKTKRTVKKLYRVKANYVMDTEFTAEHPYYAIRKNGKRFGCIKGDPEWVNVQQLKKGDLLCIPKARYDNKLPDALFISDYVDNVDHDGSTIYRKMGFSPKSSLSYAAIVAKYNVSKPQTEKAIQYLRGATNVISPVAIGLAVKLQQDEAFSIPEPVKIPDKIIVDDDFLYFCGWYLAEGSCDGGRRIDLDMHKNEKHVAIRLQRWVKETFGINAVVSDNGAHKCRIRIASSILAEFMEKLFGSGCDKKVIPFLIENGGRKTSQLINGLFSGDGHFSRNNKMIVLSTTSPHVALKVRDILTSVDILVGISRQQRGTHKPMYELSIPRPMIDRFLTFVGMETWEIESRCDHFMEREDGFFVPVKSIEQYDTDEEVYDICVDNTHCFVANGVLVHNTLNEAMATGLPCIATEYSGTADFFDSYVGYPIEYELRPFYHAQYELHTTSAAPSVNDLAEKMQHVHNNYTEARVKARKAAQRIRHKFTWQKAAERLVEIVRDNT